MNAKTCILVSVLSIVPFISVFAQEPQLPRAPASVAVPAVPPVSADINLLKAQYDEYYSALQVFSDKAYAARQDSSEFLEYSATGKYLRAILDNLSVRISSATGAVYQPEPSKEGGKVSARVTAEVESVFNFSGIREGETRGVPIKPGYCQINYVKNNTPFLVQFDGFLNKGEVILTFDDGPGPLTEEVSTSMKDAGAQVLFFVLGINLGDNGKIRIKAETADGHLVGVHGYNHATPSGKPFTALSLEETLRQLGNVNSSIASAIGKKSSFFRPPYGVISPEAVRAIYSDIGLVPVGWTIDTLDWSTKDPETLYQNTISMIAKRGKGIVLMHDIHPQSRTASKRLVKWLAENGYKVVSPERLVQAYKGE
ncbi:MAG: polysaccharide deacetylase family protein [Elusimicrobia bacterium]|nr:polysaccharide deacetylase family protein [Elusimicrobiota bacterium]